MKTRTQLNILTAILLILSLALITAILPRTMKPETLARKIEMTNNLNR